MDGLHELVLALDSLVVSGRKADIRLVVVKPSETGELDGLPVTGAETADFLRAYQGRLVAPTGSSVVPHVLLTLSPGQGAPDRWTVEDVKGILEEVAREFGRSMPPGTGDLALGQYHLVRDTLNISLESGRPDRERQTELRRRLFSASLRRKLGGSRPDGTGLPPWAALLVSVLTVAAPWLFGLWATRRLSWLPKHDLAEGQVAPGLFAALVDLTAGNSPGQAPDHVGGILVRALLEDLARAHRRAFLRVSWNRRQRWSFVLLVEVPDDAGEKRLLLLDQVRRQLSVPARLVVLVARTGTAPQPAERSTILALPTGGNTAPGPAAVDLRGIARKRTSLSPGDVVHVPLARGPVGGTLPATMEAPGRRKRDWARPTAFWAAITLAVAALVVYVAFPAGSSSGTCAGVREAGGEWIGITDGACELSTDQGFVELERRIHAANQEVVARGAESGRRYATVVYFAPMTVPNEPGQVGRGSLEQIRGAYLAQQQANEAAQNDSGNLPVRLLLANAGDRFRYGAEVVGRIVELAGVDDTVMAVTGIGQSRTVAKDALRVLDRERIPVIGSAVVGDSMQDGLNFYVQISAVNRRIARVTAPFTAELEVAGGDGAGPAESVVLVSSPDPNDLFSRNLADDFADEFRRSRAGRPEPRWEEVDYGEDPEYSVPPLEVARTICDEKKKGPMFVFYASRGQRLPALLDALRSTPGCGSGSPLTIVGNTDVPRLINDGTITSEDLGTVNLIVPTYLTFDDARTTAAEDLARRYSATGWGGSPDSDTALGRDSVFAASRAITETYGSGENANFDVSAVAGTLRAGLSFTGASGLIELGQNHRHPPNRPILLQRFGQGQWETLLSCGSWDSGPRGTDSDYAIPGASAQADAGRRPCPTDLSP